MIVSAAREQLKRAARSSPPRLRRAAARTVWGPLDAFESVTGRRPADVPPRGLRRYVGGGSFEGAREGLLEDLIGVGGLEPTDRVLDVGCGIGRIAAPLTGYLTEGSYDGIDVVPEGVRWAQRRISPRHPGFRFHLCDVYNRYYNRAGTHSAAEYVFPFGDDSFDFALATSLFTHLMPAGLANYLAEIARVVAPHGRCFLTFFVVDDVARESIESGRSSLAFVPGGAGGTEWWTIAPSTPEAAIGFDEGAIRAAVAAAGLELIEPIVYGSWSGRDGLRGQDIVLARPA